MRRIILLLALIGFCVSQAGAQVPILETSLALKYIAFTPKRTAHAPVVILLHGYGSDENDLFGLRASFPPNYIVISARAPYELAGGGFQWYEMQTIDGHRDGKKDELSNSRELVTKFIDQIVDRYDANPRSVYVMGFSQGAIMSYAVGLTAPEKVKGIGVLSGMLYPSIKESIKMSPTLKRLKIFVAHGSADQRIPYAYGKAGQEHLASLGLKPDFHEYKGMEHSISGEEMKDLIGWMKL